MAEARAAHIGFVAAGLAAVAALLRLYARSHALHGGARVLDPGPVGAMISRTPWGWVVQVVGTILALAGFRLGRRGSTASSTGREHPERTFSPEGHWRARE